MIQADDIYLRTGLADYDAVAASFGGEKRLSSLISGNVAPGWDAIYIIDCGEPCTWTIDQPVEGEPWWIPARGETATASLSEDNVTYLGGDPEPELWQFSVPMQILVAADDKEQALGRAMQIRDAIGMSGDPTAALGLLDFHWHLHHPNGC